MVPSALPLLTSRERDEARRLIERQGLSFEEDCDELVGIHEGGRLVAAAGRAGYVLKMFAIDEAHQGADMLGQLATALIGSGRRSGHEALFVYTRPEHAASFEACNFRLLAACHEVALLEHGGGFEEYLKTRLRDVGLVDDGGVARALSHGAGTRQAAAVVVNGNPFTRGHLFLVETAAARSARLYVLVVREDRSVFPFAARLRMAREATRHLPNVVVLDTSRYAVSSGTFPAYFLRQHDRAARLQMEVDAALFAGRVAPAFGIARRFVGHEPYCPATAAYNEVLAEVLPQHGVALEVVERLGDEGGFVSASRVRALLAAGDTAGLARLVPESTLAFLQSEEGMAVRQKLQGSRGMLNVEC
jgi:[citrate (pro-3S)-lyase] ligase